MTVARRTQQEVEARRALVLHDRPLVVDLITLTLNHGVFAVRAARTLAEAEAILAEWSPHMAVIDMDHDDSTALLERLGGLEQPDAERDAGPGPDPAGRPARPSCGPSTSGSTTS